jgi:NAD(P)-dependent dehydrogenase (short-subunit alcohol dehydrogenase family)
MSNLRFDGRVAIVTGSGRGIGREHALLLASRGARVVVNDLGGGPFGGGGSTEPAEETAAEIVDRGGEAVANFGDVGSEADVEALVAQAVDAFGRIDIVVNNAGIDRFAPFAEMTRAVFDQMIAVHLGGSFQVTRSAWPHMVAQGYGRVVMTSSRAAFGIPAQAHYAAAKTGVIGLMRALSLEGREHGINVNAVMPSAWTRMSAATFEETDAVALPASRDFPPELVSPAVAWLAHESCEASGEILDVAVGYVGRVFFGVTPGHVDPELSIESVRDHWAEICDESGYSVPANTRDVPFGGRTLGSM